MALAFVAYAVLAAQDATVKWLVVTVPVWQVLFCRSVVVTAGCLAVGGAPLARHVVTSPLRMALVGRGTVTLVAWLCYFTAARSLPLGQLVTLQFAAPLFVVVLAVRLLDERVGALRWAAVGLGFLGTVVATEPGAMSFSYSAALTLLGAFLWAYGVILTRLIARRESSLVQMLASNLVFLVGTGVMTALQWHAPTASEAWLCLLVGVLGGVGQLALFEAIRRAPASLLAPVEYSALPWAFLLGYAIWAAVPDAGVLGGAALIVVAGLALVMGERLRGRWRDAASPVATLARKQG